MKHSVEGWFGNERIHGSVRVRSSKVAGYHRENRTNLSGDKEDSWCGRHRGLSAPLGKSTSFGVGSLDDINYVLFTNTWA